MTKNEVRAVWPEAEGAGGIVDGEVDDGVPGVVAGIADVGGFERLPSIRKPLEYGWISHLDWYGIGRWALSRFEWSG